MRQEKNFVDFVVEAQWSKDLANGFARAKTADELKTFFYGRGFTAITEQECNALASSKANIGPQIQSVIDGPEPMY